MFSLADVKPKGKTRHPSPSEGKTKKNVLIIYCNKVNNNNITRLVDILFTDKLNK